MEGKRLYVGNLTYAVNEGNLRELFGTYGEIESVKVIEQKGFGFVEMVTSEQAQAAMDALNGTDYEGRTLRIDEARPMQPRRDFGGNSGGFGGNRNSSGGSGGYNRRY
jgi:RNA recognition motif-containing protein